MPDDVDQDAVKATFKNGVLTVIVPRRFLQKSNVKQIEIQTEK